MMLGCMLLFVGPVKARRGVHTVAAWRAAAATHRCYTGVSCLVSQCGDVLCARSPAGFLGVLCLCPAHHMPACKRLHAVSGQASWRPLPHVVVREWGMQHVLLSDEVVTG